MAWSRLYLNNIIFFVRESNLKIIYLHQYFNTPSMSGGTRSYEMARRLVQMGHEVHMITSWRGDCRTSDWFITNEDGITVHWFPVAYSNSFSDFQRVGAFLKFLIAVTRRCWSMSADLVFATSTPLTIAIPGYLTSKRLSIPMVFEVRDLWPTLPIAIGSLNNPFLRWLAFKLERFAYFNSSQVIALSDGMKDGVVASGYDSRKVHVIPNSCDLELFSVADDGKASSRFRAENNIPGDAKLIVYCGTFGRINGVDYLVDLASSLDDIPDLYFMAIGEGAEFDDVAELAELRGVLNGNFRLLPSISKAEMPNILAAADFATSLFIPLKEMEANSANKFFDALAAGLPVLLNYGGWQSKLLVDNDAGLQLDRDIKVAADQLRQVLFDSQKICRWGVNARNLGESQFSRDDLALKLEHVFKEAVNESGH